MSENNVFTSEQFMALQELSKFTPEQIKALKNIAQDYVEKRIQKAEFDIIRGTVIAFLEKTAQTDKYVDKKFILGLLDYFKGLTLTSTPYYTVAVIRESRYTIDKISNCKHIKVEEKDFLPFGIMMYAFSLNIS